MSEKVSAELVPTNVSFTSDFNIGNGTSPIGTKEYNAGAGSNQEEQQTK